MKHSLLLLMLFITGNLFATDYYVSNSEGDDANDGLTESTPWKTLGKLYNNSSIKAGDVVHLKRGDVWYGQALRINQNGEAGNPITFTSYGTGDLPEVRAMATFNDTVTWTETSEGSHIWTNTISEDEIGSTWNEYYYIERLYINGKEVLGTPTVENVGSTVPDTVVFHYDKSNQLLTLYSEVDPSTLKIECSNLQYALDFVWWAAPDKTNKYVNVENIKFVGGNLRGARLTPGQNIKITNCEFGEAAYIAMEIKGSSTNNSKNIVIDGCKFDGKYNFDFSGAAVSTTSFKRGPKYGIWGTYSDSVVIKNSTFKNFTDASLRLEDNSNGQCTNYKVHDNIFTETLAAHGGRVSICTGVENLEFYNNIIDNVCGYVHLRGNNNHYHHNIIKNVRKSPLVSRDQGFGISTYNDYEVDGSTTNNIYENNVITGCAKAGIHLRGGSSFNTSNNIFRNNILADNGIGLWIEDYGSPQGERVKNNTFDNNLFFNDIVHIYGHSKTMEQFNAFTDYGTSTSGNLSGDPLFADPENGDYHLQSGSPAIDNGTTPLATLDFEGNTIPFPGTTPDIGIYEYQSVPDSNVLKNGDFEEQGVWEVFKVKGSVDSSITFEFGNTEDTPKYGENGCMVITKRDSGAFAIHYLVQKIKLVVGKTYEFTGAFKGLTDTTGLGTTGYGWWDQIFIWPAVEDKMLNVDSLKANPGLYAGPGHSDFNTAVFCGLTSWGATGYGMDTVFGDLPGFHVYGDNIGRGAVTGGQGDTTIYIVPAALQRTTDILELGEIGDTIDYWFIMNVGHWGSTNGVEIKTAYDKFALRPIADTVSPDCEITSDASGETSSAFKVSFNFKEAVTGFDISDIVVGNGVASNLQETAVSTIWTADITPTSSGVVTVDVPAGAVTDAAGNGNNAAEQFSINYTEPNVLKNGDFEEQGVWEVFKVKGSVDSSIVFEFGNTEDTPKFGEDGCMVITKRDSGAFAIHYLAQKIKLVVGQTYEFTGAFKGLTDTTGMGTTGYGWWDQIFIWPAVEDKMLNVDSLKANPGLYAGPGQSDFNTAVFCGLTSWGATGYGMDTVFGDLPGFHVYGDNIGRGAVTGGQGDTTIYIVPAALQRTTDILELGEIGDTIDYWFIMNVGHWGSTNGVEIKTAYDEFALKPIPDTVPPNVIISSNVSGDVDSAFTVSFNFKEAVTGFDISDIVVGNGVASNLQETAVSTIWTADITPTSSGVVTVDVPAGAVTDAAGNGNIEGEQFSVNYNPTGINDELFESNISVYPNPSKGIINLRINNNGNNTISLSVIDITGRKLLQKQITGSRINEPIRLNGIGKGYYILRISNGKETVTRSIIVE